MDKGRSGVDRRQRRAVVTARWAALIGMVTLLVASFSSSEWAAYIQGGMCGVAIGLWLIVEIVWGRSLR